MVRDTDKFVRDARASQDNRTNSLTLILLAVGGGALVLAALLAFAVPRGATRLLTALDDERRTASLAEAETAQLQDMTAAIAVASTTSEVAQAVLEKGQGATGAAAGSIALLDRDGETLTTFGLVGYTGAITEAFRTYSASAPLPIPDCLSGGPMFLEDAAAVIARYPHLGELHAGTGHEAIAALPLTRDGRAIGGLTMSFAEPRHFDVAERAFLATIADLCAQALERARLYENEHREAERQQFLAEASALLTSSLEPRATLSSLARLSVPTLGDWCSVTLGIQGRLERVAIAHTDPDKLALAQAFLDDYPPQLDDRGGIADVLRSGRSEFTPVITDELIDSSVAPGERRARIKALGPTSAMTVPLTARGRTLGALTMVSDDPHRHFDTDDLRFAEDLGARAGVAVYNVLLYERSRHIATTLQQSLLPAALPSIAGLDVTARYSAAGEGIDVGGDFYDLFELPSAAGWAAVLGDVCGKGPDAASLTALARYTIRAEADALSPSAVLRRLNDAVLHQRGDGRFLTVSYVWLRPTPAGLTASFARGGHTPILILRASGEVERYVPRGSLVGIIPDAVFEEDEVSLSRGDTLILFSDGVTESRSAEREEFGIARLTSLLETMPAASADTIATAIERALTHFRQGPPRDDVALLVVSFTGTAPATGQRGDGQRLGLSAPGS